MSEVFPRGREAHQLSRRRFLRTTCVAGAAILSTRLLPSVCRAAPDAPTTAPADKFQIDGGLVTLPAKGTLYIANDFHTRHADFARWLKQTDLAAKLKSDGDVYGLILGDVIDKKPLDAEAEDDGDLRMLDEIRKMQSAPGGDRLIYVLGNHEYEVIRLYEALKTQLGMTDRNRKRIIQLLYNSEHGADYQQWNFIERIHDEHLAWFKRLPLAVLCHNGLVAVHAGPAKAATGTGQIVKRDEEVTKELVWSRPITNYEPKDVDGFLKIADQSRLMVVGHTPVGLLPPELVHNGLCFIGEHAAVMAASYGALPGQKQHLVVDLAKRYGDVNDLVLNKEIRPMIPPAVSPANGGQARASSIPVYRQSPKTW